MAAGVIVRHFAQDRPARDIPRRVLRRALARAHAHFARQYPERAASLFDEHFLAQRAELLLLGHLTRGAPLDPATLAQEWAEQIC